MSSPKKRRRSDRLAAKKRKLENSLNNKQPSAPPQKKHKKTENNELYFEEITEVNIKELNKFNNSILAIKYGVRWYKKSNRWSKRFGSYLVKKNENIIGAAFCELKQNKVIDNHNQKKKEKIQKHLGEYCYIDTIAVAKNERRQKIGTAMIKQIEKVCKIKTISRIELDCSELYTKKFYIKNGFKQFGLKQENFYEKKDILNAKHDCSAWHMIKNLS